MLAYLYILRSTATRRSYVGSTRDIHRRFAEHQRGQTASTRNGRPWEIACPIEFLTISDAHAIERMLKHMKSKAVLNDLIESCW